MGVSLAFQIAPRHCLLLLAETFFPPWRITVSGYQSPPSPELYQFLDVILPNGEAAFSYLSVCFTTLTLRATEVTNVNFYISTYQCLQKEEEVTLAFMYVDTILAFTLVPASGFNSWHSPSESVMKQRLRQAAHSAVDTPFFREDKKLRPGPLQKRQSACSAARFSFGMGSRARTVASASRPVQVASRLLPSARLHPSCAFGLKRHFSLAAIKKAPVWH